MTIFPFPFGFPFGVRLIAGAGLLASLAACESPTGPLSAIMGSDEIIVQCPDTGVLAQAERLERYRETDERDITDLVLDARIGDLRNVCSIRQEDRLLGMDLHLTVTAERGPAATVGEPQSLSYFVAVVDDADRVLRRDGYPLRATFDGTARQAVFREELTIGLPIPPGKNVGDFRIFLGLQLTRGELDRVYEEQGP